MNEQVGIWIDHERAILVFASEGGIRTKTVASHVPGHPHYAGQPNGGGEKKYEARHGQHLDRFYDEVIRELADSDELWIFGPGEAKFGLKARLNRSTPQAARILHVETADKLTNPQIVAKVKAHFGIAR
jgi:hypothetical protein